MEKLEPSCAAGGNVNGAATVEKRLAAPQKVKRGATVCSGVPTFRWMPKRHEDGSSDKYFDMSVHSGSRAGNNTSAHQLMDG